MSDFACVLTEDNRALREGKLQLLDGIRRRGFQADSVLLCLVELLFTLDAHVVSHVAEGLSLRVDNNRVLLTDSLIDDDHVLVGCALVWKATDGPV